MKVKAIVVVILCVGLTAVLSGRSWSWTAVVAGLASLGILVIVRLPSLPPETP